MTSLPRQGTDVLAVTSGKPLARPCATAGTRARTRPIRSLNKRKPTTNEKTKVRNESTKKRDHSVRLRRQPHRHIFFLLFLWKCGMILHKFSNVERAWPCTVHTGPATTPTCAPMIPPRGRVPPFSWHRVLDPRPWGREAPDKISLACAAASFHPQPPQSAQPCRLQFGHM